MTKQDKPSTLDMFMKIQEDCDRPACDDTVSALSSALNRLNKNNNKGKDKDKEVLPTASASKQEASLSAKACPPSKSVIGDSAWTLMHSMAAWYPEKPTAREERQISNFMEAVSIFYPCSYCATDFQANMKTSPVRTESRKDLCQWLCEQHNMVNEKLGKEVFKCDIKSLDERWRKSSDPDCNP
mmetsp:Transcript_21626/g.32011  ORF Transcript_21626/g.32011 Transcript_21626/m.32011 type:complete len:184 (+) Transcript_21626:130-681(+)